MAPLGHASACCRGCICYKESVSGGVDRLSWLSLSVVHVWGAGCSEAWWPTTFCVEQCALYIQVWQHTQHARQCTRTAKTPQPIGLCSPLSLSGPCALVQPQHKNRNTRTRCPCPCRLQMTLVFACEHATACASLHQPHPHEPRSRPRRPLAPPCRFFCAASAAMRALKAAATSSSPS